MFEIQTQRLTIRDMLVSDAELFVGLLQDKEYQRFYSEADCRPEHYRHLAQLFIAQSQESPRKAYQLAITCKTSGEFIGIVCLRLELEHQASLGSG
ncbi:acetyltransferase [Vibrio ponticus]|nr:acetyltransferase [Vibrio ponticus]